MIVDVQLPGMFSCLDRSNFLQQKAANCVFVNNISGVPSCSDGSSKEYLAYAIVEGPASANRLCNSYVSRQPVSNTFGKESNFACKTKHVEVRYHFIREKVLGEEVELKQIKIEHQVADLFTKGLSGNKFENLCHQLCMVKKTEASVEALQHMRFLEAEKSAYKS